MRSKYIFVVLSLLFLSSACFSSPSDKEKERERKLAKLMNTYSQNEENKTSDISEIDEMAELIDKLDSKSNNKTDNNIDYSNIKISDDSIDIVLHKLIAYPEDLNVATLLKNIEILIGKGAKPNAVVSISSSSRKAGSYIPIVKHFFKNKYRSYTYTSTAFHAAVEKGNIKVVQKLIDLGAQTGIPTKEGNYPIDISVKNNNIKMIDFLLSNGSDIKKINLADSKNIALIEKLVNLGANPNTIDINFALKDKTKLKRLLALKPGMQNLELNFGILFNDNELLDLLLDNGLPLSTIGTFPDACPLIFGPIKYNNAKAFKKLIALGANKSATCKGGFGDTPLLRAIYYENAEIVEYLLEIGANPNEKEWTKKSALSNAAETDNDKIINLLIDAGAQIEHSEYFGKTPIMQAVSRTKYIAVKTLIDRGANVNFKNKYSGTPLVMAIKENDYPIIKLLVEGGAKTNIRFEGKTLAEYAKEEGASPMIIDYLQAAK